MTKTRTVAPTIFGRRMRRPKYAAAGTYTLHAGELSVNLWAHHSYSGGARRLGYRGRVYPFGVDFYAESPVEVAAAIETWLVKQLFGETLVALGFEVRRARS